MKALTAGGKLVDVVQIPVEALLDRNLSHGARLLYAVLLHYAGNGDACQPDPAELVTSLRGTPQGLTRWRGELVARHYCTVELVSKPPVYHLSKL